MLKRKRVLTIMIVLIGVLLLTFASWRIVCVKKVPATIEEQYALAVHHHQMIAGRQGQEREKMIHQTKADYQAVLDRFPEARSYSAESRLALGHLDLLSGDTTSALVRYQSVIENYPDRSFTRLQALKSVFDVSLIQDDTPTILFTSKEILRSYGGPDQPPAVRQVVEGVKTRLSNLK